MVHCDNIVKCDKASLVAECFKKLKNEESAAFDFETVGFSPFKYNVDVWSAAFAFGDDSCYAIPLMHGFWPAYFLDKVKKSIVRWLVELNQDQNKIAHNLKFDFLWALTKCGNYKSYEDVKRLHGVWHDTSFLCWLLDESPGQSSLKLASKRYLGVKNWAINVRDVRKVQIDNLLHYNALDAFYTLKLWQVLYDKVQKIKNFNVLYKNIMLPSCFQFLKCQWSGVPIDMELYKKKVCDNRSHLDKLVVDIYKQSGMKEKDLKSPISLIDYFSRRKKYSWNEKTMKGEISVSKFALAEIVGKYNDGVAKDLLQYKKHYKIQNTYLDGLAKYIFKGNLHGGFHLTGTVTGRVNSNEPNMQNFPKREEAHIREIVKSPPGYVLASFDYGQIEARISAMITKDDVYCKALYDKFDIHLENAREVFGDDKAAESRYKMKQATFAMLYGAGDKKIAGLLDIDIFEAKSLRDFLLGKFPKLMNHGRVLEKYLDKHGFLESLFGRRRRKPIGYTDMLNYIQQSSASDMTLSSMVHLARKYRLALMIHDDLSFFIKDDDNLHKELSFIGNAMLCIPWFYINKDKVGDHWVPLSVECKVGYDWYNQDEMFNMDSLYCNLNSYDASGEKSAEYIEELNGYGW